MRRRTLLLGLAAGIGGSAVAGTAALAATPAAAVLSSTQESTLAARAVTAYRPLRGIAPPAVTSIGREDYVFTRAGRTLHTRVWYPAGRGPYPVVVFSHGLLSQPADYTALLSGWARAGFVVAAPLYPHTSLGAAGYNAYDIVNQPADASAVLDQILALNFQPGPLCGRLDATRLAAAGHSAGGITTAGLFSKHRDARLKAGVILAGTDFLGTPFSGPPAALLFVQGKLDRTVTHRAATTVFNAVPWSRAMLTVTAGDHQTTDAELPAVGGTSAAFLHWSLYGGKPALAIPAALGGVATLDDQLNPERAAATSAASAS